MAPGNRKRTGTEQKDAKDAKRRLVAAHIGQECLPPWDVVVSPLHVACACAARARPPLRRRRGNA
eukprot:CAMPEP_0206844662 /NCGR_PEP_ID=MMETSP0975-20121206/24090_1 /ASSEMBLY_ACC=CAM_ASM_000399 /TAXON_ID=483370 /ORGANISM="non described non described, Strain CCMP2097" /LENGTH=64 /DNA_ID=CAMNT_0054387225 /DNA_START=236 /DNA_END=427 /DNA_ORIENTATION=-